MAAFDEFDDGHTSHSQPRSDNEKFDEHMFSPAAEESRKRTLEDIQVRVTAGLSKTMSSIQL